MKTAILFGIALAGSLAACDDKTPKPDPSVTSRSEAVAATGAAASAKPTAPAHPTVAAPTAPRKLCETPPSGAGRSLPSMKVDHLEASGAPSVGERVSSSAGKWTWVNFWAAWCGPCKEEIPRLRSFEQKLNQGGAPVALVFVSMDDDDRQAKQFLDGQPATGLRSSFWLPDGKIRSGFMESLKLKESPQLPIQLFFDPAGTLRCLVDGAVDDTDYPQLQSLFAKR